MKTLITLTGIFLFSVANAQNATEEIRSGNELYKQQQYEQAAASFQKALAVEPGNTTAKFNLANALYRQGRQDEAAKMFTELAAYSTDPKFRSTAFYNKGVIQTKQKKLEESIESYKEALRQNPDDNQARENLQKALLELKKKNPPPKKQQDKKKQQQQQKQQQQPKMSQKEAEQRLKLLEQKEKEVQERLQKEKSKSGGGQGKDW
jgi:Ca-activated chloride channel family protein